METRSRRPGVPRASTRGLILNGCFPSAQREVIGGGNPGSAFFINDSNYFLQTMNSTAVRAVLENDAIDDLQPDWSECMAEAGYTYTSFTGVRASFVGDIDAPNNFERAIATIDAECRESTGIADLGNELFNAAAGGIIDERQAALAFISTELELINARAQDALN